MPPRRRCSPDDQSLATLFWDVGRDLRRLGRDSGEPGDLPPSQTRALLVLGRHGSMRLHELSDHLRIARRSTTEVVDFLEGRGLVERTPDPDDRRAVLVSPTVEGNAVLQSLRQARTTRADAYFARLPAEDRWELARILDALRAP